MTSNAIRGIRRKKSSLSEVKIAVLGAPGVGKSALIVRFLTKRYIGEYDHQAEQRYRNEILVDGEPVLFEILDTCNKTMEALPSQETINWADGFLLVYSITDRQSFNWVKRVRLHICERKAGGRGSGLSSAATLTPTPPLPPSGGMGGDISPTLGPPMVLLANKADMVHLRQVSTEEGEILAKDLECFFCEVAASEHVMQVANAFHEVFKEVQNMRKRNKTSLLDRVLGSKATRIYVRGKSDSALPKD
ncbi:ras-related and estrogen-regulated growth inhibitor-like isoform X1 [Portunus trituberculatus]|uniref:ras-related and estrogen-regulated growth inhibitor-like isoform X1 n=1 Tax=Portunus trituberculatus TaxID=210409 RepID=UPI001E1CE055|nr:ras-related and estrogen-regulated growth inhibitor-like isoform X1 [Portunus trituberculatus]